MGVFRHIKLTFFFYDTSINFSTFTFVTLYGFSLFINGLFSILVRSV